MQFSSEKRGDITYVTIVGVMENTEANALVEPMEELLEAESREIVFDLSKVPYMTSSAIGKFVILHRNLVQNGRHMRVRGIDPELLELFKDIRLDTLFPIETS